MRIHARKQRLKDALSMRAEVEARLNAIRAKETKAGRRMEAGEPRAKRVVCCLPWIAVVVTKLMQIRKRLEERLLISMT